MYDDDDEIRDVLRALAERERFESIDSGPVIHRGRRGVRRRRLAATSVAAAMVAAVAMTAASLPDVGASGRLAPAGPPLTRLPEAGEGDDALRRVSGTETLRRCRLQWSAVAGRDVGPLRLDGGHYPHPDLFDRPAEVIQWKQTPPHPAAKPNKSERNRSTAIRLSLELSSFPPGTLQRVRSTDGKQFICMIPGDSSPTADALAEDAREGSISTDDAGLLRRCSTIFWHDMTRWRVLARQVEPGIAASVAAMSPSGKFVLHCVVTGRSLRDDVYNAPSGLPRISGVQRPPAAFSYYVLTTHGGTLILDPGVQTCGRQRVPCVGQLFYDSGRVPLNVARLVATTAQGRSFEIPVQDGWFAAAFGSRIPGQAGEPGALGRLTAYDANGAVLGATQFAAMPRK